MTYANTNKRDENEAEIVRHWREAGYLWLAMKPGQGFDGLLVAPSGVYIVEIKNPRTGIQLTPCEAAFRDRVEALGQEYNIIVTLEDAKWLTA